MKSTYILHFSFAFLTITKFEIHSGQLTFLMKPACNNFLTSLFIATYLSLLKHFLFYFTGLTFSLITNLWHAILILIPSISLCDQANTSICAQRHATSFFFTLLFMLVSILTFFFLSLGLALTSSSCSIVFCLSFFFILPEHPIMLSALPLL